MWNGKLKAVTFSFDDGVLEDEQIIKLFDKYGIKASFNLNSAKFGLWDKYEFEGKTYERHLCEKEDVKEKYKNHEICVHTLTHALLPSISDSSIIWQVEQDRKVLSSLVGYEVRGMAYPCGGINNDERVRKVIKDNTNVLFCRTITSTHNFDLQTGDKLYNFDPTVYWCQNELYDDIDRFINLKSDKPQLLYIWGHGYEITSGRVDLVKLEEYIKKLVSCDDIFFGTNSECLLNIDK